MSPQSPEQNIAPPKKEFFARGEAFSHKCEGRPINQDAYFLYKDNQGIFDGVTGSLGEIAAQTASDVCKNKMGHLPTITTTKQETQQVYAGLRKILKIADKEVYKKSTKLPEPINATALISHLFINHEGQLEDSIANSGDTRVYLLRGDNFVQLTIDDGVIKKENPNNVREIQKKFSNVHYAKLELSQKEQELFRKRNLIISCVGDGKCKPTLYSMILKEGDILFFSTDGVHDNLTDNELENAIKEGKSAQEIVMMALERSRKQDKIETRKDLKGRAKNDDKTCMIVEITKA